MTKAMSIPAAKAAVDREWGKFKNRPPWDVSNVRDQEDVSRETQALKVTNSLRNVAGLLPLGARGVGSTFADVQRKQSCSVEIMSKTISD